MIQVDFFVIVCFDAKIPFPHLQKYKLVSKVISHPCQNWNGMSKQF